jgi:hypothetical protein
VGKPQDGGFTPQSSAESMIIIIKTFVALAAKTASADAKSRNCILITLERLPFKNICE